MSYDTVPYLCFPVTTSEPRRVGALARLYGVHAAHPRRARVLELGCGLGGNLLPLAVAWPEAAFVGVDQSGVQVGSARLDAEALELRNVQFVHGDIRDFEPSGTFDYVICHGVFSWVEAPVRERILGICAEVLAPNGVAFVSYNALPGWNIRQSVRQILLREVSEEAAPRDRIARAREVLGQLSREVDGALSAFAIVLESEVNGLADYADSYLLHEHLAGVNEAFYLEDFVASAERHGLRFAGDAQPSLLDVTRRPGLAAHQWLDYALNNTFRETLLVRAGEQPGWIPDPSALLGLYGVLRGPVPRPDGLDVSAWAALVNAPRGLRLDVFGEDAAEDLMDLVVAGELDIALCPVPAAVADGRLGRGSPLARLQVLEGREQVTTLGHEDVTLDAPLAEVLLELDGRKSRTALLAALSASQPGFGEDDLNDALYELSRRCLLVD